MLTGQFIRAAMNAGAANKPFLTLYSHMCSCIIYELSLSKFPNEEQYSTVCFKAWGSKPSNGQPKNRTMEERRLVLGFWFITSVYVASSLFAFVSNDSSDVPLFSARWSRSLGRYTCRSRWS